MWGRRWLDDKRPGCSLHYELWPGADGGQASCTAWQLVLFTGVPGCPSPALSFEQAIHTHCRDH